MTLIMMLAQWAEVSGSTYKDDVTTNMLVKLYLGLNNVDTWYVWNTLNEGR